MDKGARAFVIMLAVSALLGAVVTAFHPLYRNTFLSLLGQGPENSPIWTSNRGYYEAVTLTSEEEPARHEQEAPHAE